MHPQAGADADARDVAGTPAPGDTLCATSAMSAPGMTVTTPATTVKAMSCGSSSVIVPSTESSTPPVPLHQLGAEADRKSPCGCHPRRFGHLLCMPHTEPPPSRVTRAFGASPFGRTRKCKRPRRQGEFGSREKGGGRPRHAPPFDERNPNWDPQAFSDPQMVADEFPRSLVFLPE